MIVRLLEYAGYRRITKESKLQYDLLPQLLKHQEEEAAKTLLEDSDFWPKTQSWMGKKISENPKCFFEVKKPEIMSTMHEFPVRVIGETLKTAPRDTKFEPMMYLMNHDNFISTFWSTDGVSGSTAGHWYILRKFNGFFYFMDSMGGKPNKYIDNPLQGIELLPAHAIIKRLATYGVFQFTVLMKQ